MARSNSAANIALGGHADFIPDFLGFTYVRNTGAAFSSFEGAQWLFVVVFVVLTAVVVILGVGKGIEKCSKVMMPILVVLCIIVAIYSLTLPGASEGLKFMFVPGYAVEGGFIEEAPGLLTVLATIAFAGPVAQRRDVYSQPDGTTFNVKLRGDEWIKLRTTEDGCDITKDEGVKRLACIIGKIFMYSYKYQNIDMYAFGFGDYINIITPE